MNGRRRLVGSFNHGTMANALPQAIGVQAAQPGRQVVTLSGDGGLAMLFGELLTLRQLALPVKVVVFNNGSLAFVDLEMKAAGIVNYATDLDNPNFAEVAHAGPAVIDIVTARQELSMPPKLTLEQIKGFTLYATRTILSGRGDEILELAKTNLRALAVE